MWGNRLGRGPYVKSKCSSTSCRNASLDFNQRCSYGATCLPAWGPKRPFKGQNDATFQTSSQSSWSRTVKLCKIRIALLRYLEIIDSSWQFIVWPQWAPSYQVGDGALYAVTKGSLHFSNIPRIRARNTHKGSLPKFRWALSPPGLL